MPVCAPSILDVSSISAWYHLIKATRLPTSSMTPLAFVASFSASWALRAQKEAQNRRDNQLLTTYQYTFPLLSGGPFVAKLLGVAEHHWNSALAHLVSKVLESRKKHGPAWFATCKTPWLHDCCLQHFSHWHSTMETQNVLLKDQKRFLYATSRQSCERFRFDLFVTDLQNLEPALKSKRFGGRGSESSNKAPKKLFLEVSANSNQRKVYWIILDSADFKNWNSLWIPQEKTKKGGVTGVQTFTGCSHWHEFTGLNSRTGCCLLDGSKRSRAAGISSACREAVRGMVDKFVPSYCLWTFMN